MQIVFCSYGSTNQIGQGYNPLLLKEIVFGNKKIMHIYAHRRTTYKNVSRRPAVRFQDHNVVGLNKIRQRLDRLRDVPGGQERDQGARVAHNDDHGYHHPAANQGHFTPVGKPFG